MERASNLRMIALAGTVALAVALPLAAATAGPAVTGGPGPEPAPNPAPTGGEPTAGGVARVTRAADGGTGTGAAREGGKAGSGGGSEGASHGRTGTDGSHGPGAGFEHGPQSERGGTAGGGGGARTGADAAERDGLLAGLGLDRKVRAGRRTAECGPELASPEGVEAQTCVLREGGETWAGTYYRNTSGASPRAVLSLLRPDGRTVQVHCAPAAGDEPGACETPRSRTVRSRGVPYSAVAEISDSRDERLLLRSGSNSAAPMGGSDQ